MNKINDTFNAYFGNERIDTSTSINNRKGNDNMQDILRVTMEGKLASQGKDGFYYSVTPKGQLKREYSVFKNVSDKIITKERTCLDIGDLLIYEDKLAFCSGDLGNQYSITMFSDNSVRQIQKSIEGDDLGETYAVVINPLDSMMKNDPDVDIATLLGTRTENAGKIGLNLQIQQSKTLASIAEALQNLSK